MVVGPVADRYGPRRLIILGVIALAGYRALGVGLPLLTVAGAACVLLARRAGDRQEARNPTRRPQLEGAAEIT